MNMISENSAHNHYGLYMAHPKETRDTLRRAYVFSTLSLELAAAIQCGVSFATARR